MEDNQIIELYWQRSENAIAETSNKYSRLLLSISLNILGDYSDAEECENDTYVAVWNAIPPTRPNVFSAFLSKIIRNISINRYEYNKAKKRNNEYDLILSELEECVASSMLVEDCYAAGEISELINDFLKTQKQETRVIFVRRYWYADSVKDIANRMKISESKVKTVLFRVRGQLQQFLEERGVFV